MIYNIKIKQHVRGIEDGIGIEDGPTGYGIPTGMFGCRDTRAAFSTASS